MQLVREYFRMQQKSFASPNTLRDLLIDFSHLQKMWIFFFIVSSLWNMKLNFLNNIREKFNCAAPIFSFPAIVFCFEIIIAFQKKKKTNFPVINIFYHSRVNAKRFRICFYWFYFWHNEGWLSKAWKLLCIRPSTFSELSFKVHIKSERLEKHPDIN